MKLNLLLLLFPMILFSQKEPPAVTESYKLVNDINAAEPRKAIYLCRDVNNIWAGVLAPASGKDSEIDKKSFQKKLDTISKYLGQRKEDWLKNIPFVPSWQVRAKAKEFMYYKDVEADKFYKDHDQTGVYLYSSPLFNDARNKALIYIWYITGRFSVDGFFYYCEKQNGTWKKKNIALIGGFN